MITLVPVDLPGMVVELTLDGVLEITHLSIDKASDRSKSGRFSLRLPLLRQASLSRLAGVQTCLFCLTFRQSCLRGVYELEICRTHFL